MARARLFVTRTDDIAIDPGERDLIAHALTREDEWLSACCDAAAVRVFMHLGLDERLVSLEELARSAGLKRVDGLKRQHTTRWLSETRTRIRLDMS